MEPIARPTVSISPKPGDIIGNFSNDDLGKLLAFIGVTVLIVVILYLIVRRTGHSTGPWNWE
jgi:hypothetical protein